MQVVGWLLYLEKTIGQAFVRLTDRQWLAFFLLLAFGFRIGYLLLTDNYFNGDNGARLYNCWAWSVTPTLFRGLDWLPMQFYLVGTVIKLTGDVWWAPRLVSLVAGATSVLPFFYLMRMFFPRAICLIATGFFAIRPMHVKYSVISMSEALYLFFILVAFGFFFRYLFAEVRAKKNLWWCVFFLSCSGMLRMESWFYQGLLLLILFLANTNWRTLFQFLVLVSIVPLFVMLCSMVAYGDPLRSLNYSDVEVRNWAALNHITPEINLHALQNAFRKWAFILIPLGILVAWRSKKMFYYFLLFIVPFTLITYKMATLTLTGQGRYYLPSAALAFPFYILGAWWIVSKVTRLNTLRYAALLFFLWYTLLPKIEMHLSGPLHWDDAAHFRPGFKELAVWARKNLPEGARLYVGNNNYSAHQWMVYSGAMMEHDFPDEVWLKKERSRSKLKDKYFPRFKVVGYISGLNWLGEEFKAGDIHECLREHGLTHVVVFEHGVLDKSGLFNKPFVNCEGYFLYELKNIGGNRIYEVQCIPRGEIGEEGCI